MKTTVDEIVEEIAPKCLHLWHHESWSTRFNTSAEPPTVADLAERCVKAGALSAILMAADLAIDRGNHDLHHAILALIPKDSA